MIKEDYCSCDIANLIKEKGLLFAEHTSYIPKYNVDGTSELITTITHQTAMKWLREKYHIFVEISTSIDLNGNYHFSYTILDKECKYVRRKYTDFDWNYKDAVEAAIKYCLENLI